MNSSDFYDFIETRSSVRDFSSDPVSDEDLNYIIKCAGKSPSAGNRESWDVVIVTDESIKEDLSDAAFGQEHIIQAPVVLAVCANYVRSMSQYGERGILYAVEDASIAATYMMLAAHSLRLQTCWTGAFDDDEISEILGLLKHARPVTLLAIGHGTLPEYRAERMPISEHVHEETW
ncbi:nitroreductase [Methanomicrobium sp. W14]|uniref:nitroreductase family protein n=1 Tax=Methanomicrobium sp. W14 TaxID=2817839 RepID=UPI001AE8B57D|nr:nitroreductase family protein [Methanomicrobium sp. W14]MBP2132968.1 nitroreductase [Methanomicrobium sp. W14]